MLCLYRYAGQSINIGDDVVVTVVKVDHGMAHIGIDAPRSIPVHREEIYERIQRQKLAMANGNADAT